ncbi:hypothetical protein [Phocaeicola sartorii]|uniref:hypothetical protein n=1 Tax=Phocaeicola sartorii TaxID=671267 RepID=UPI00248CD9FB|nr:hypothetical protein [Phocaeicola sartorii]
MDTHYNIHARACGCAYRCVDGRRKGKEWERKGHTTYVSGEFRAHPEASHKTPTTEFCKTAATATTLFAETTMDRAFQGVVAPPFFIQKKGCCHHFHLFSTPERPVEGGKNRRRRRTKRREKKTGTDRQNYGCNQSKPRLQSVKTTVTIQWNSGYILTELKLQPDGTVVSTGWN